MGKQRLLTGAALALAVAAIVFTWYRLTRGCDLGDESFAVVVPWRWALGDRPFVDEMNLAQTAGFLTYPFIKAFTLVRGDDATGIILFARHLYLVFVSGVAAVSVVFFRRLLRWQLALAVCAVVVTVVFLATPALTFNTLAMGLLTGGFMFGLWAIAARRGSRLAGLAGLAHGMAVVAFPTLLFVMPFVALFFALAQGRRARAVVAGLTWHVPPDPRPQDGSTGPRAFRLLAAYAAGGALPLAVVGVLALAAGPRNVARCWDYTLQAARSLDQLAGAAKAVDVTIGLVGFVAGEWPFVLALAVVYLVFRRRPRLGRALLVLLPVGLYGATRGGVAAAGLVLAYGLLAPYLYAMLPAARRAAGATMLIWVWPSSAIAAAMTAYTSTEGYTHAAVGLYPAMLVSGVFLAWALEAAVGPYGDAAAGVTGGRPGAWLAFAALAAVVAVTVVLQFQYQTGGVGYGQLTARMRSGPWAGVAVTPAQQALLTQYAADLSAYARPGEALLVYFRDPGLYLYWPYRLAANSASLQGAPAGDAFAQLPESTVSWYRRTHRLPDVVVHVCPTALATGDELERCGGLQYPVVLTRRTYTVNRRPPGKTTQEILDGLPRFR